MQRDEYIRSNIDKTLYDWSKIAIGVGSLVIISLAILDYLVIPSKFYLFLKYRILSASILFTVFLIIRRRISRNLQNTGVLISALVVSTMVSAMIYQFGGHASPYSMGFILIVMYVLGLIPLSLRMCFYLTLVVYSIYLIPILIYDDITNMPFFISSNAFLLFIIFTIILLRVISQKRLLNELRLQYDLEEQKRELETFSQHLEELVNTRTAKLTETIEQLERSRGQLRNLSAHLESVREDERTRIAREIHDEMGQVLTALKMDISWLNKRFPQEKKDLLEKAHAMSEMIDSTIQSVRKISAELRPGALDDLGLAAAIEWQAGEFQKRTGISCVLNMTPQEISLDRERSTTLFRIIQEILTNVARHAEATEVSIHLAKKHDAIELRVRDNGKGIREEERDHPHSFGLLGMRERVHYWKGKINITGIPDKGTTIELSIPIQGNGEENDSRAHRG